MSITESKIVRPKPRKFVTMPVGRVLFTNINKELARNKTACAEPTGKGNLLIVDGFFGKLFRSDEGCVRDELDEYCRQYREICARLDEDPAGRYFEVMNWNDLYALHGLIPFIGGDMWGYTNTEDYRVEMGFKVDYITKGEWVEKLGEPYLWYEPYEWCYPDPCYLEV